MIANAGRWHSIVVMKRLSLGVWLAVVCVGLAGVVMLIVVPRGWSLLERLATDDARARVELGAITAAETIERQKDETLVAVEVLAARPTLATLLSGGQATQVGRFLDRYRETAQLDACAVVLDGRVVAATDADRRWPALAATPGARYEPGAENTLTIFAVAPLEAVDGAVAIGSRSFGVRALDVLGRQLGLEVRLLDPSSTVPGGSEADDFVSVRQLGNESGVAVAAVTTRAQVDATLLPVKRAFVGAATVAALMALALGIVAAQLLAAPVRRLSESADRIGAGDLETSVPRGGIGEVGPLSEAMETMRRRLKLLAAELRQRESEAQALLSGIVEGVFAVDAARRIQYLNPQAASILGVDTGAALGRFCGDVLHPLPLEGERPCDTACPIIHSRSRGSSRAVEHLDLPSGRRTVVITSAPGSADRQVQVIRDETEVEAARRSRDVVLANVSHELRTPLSAQLASIELLLDGFDGMSPDKAIDLVTSIQRSTLRLTRLVDNLLESVRIETGRAQLRRVPVEIAAVVEEAKAMTIPLLEQKGQALEVGVPAGLPDIEGDPSQLAQVLVNLIANAHKYAPAGSAIRVGAGTDGSAVSVWVEDAGPGVAIAASSSIFDRFERGAAEGEGMGLGLWIVKNIAERHGGSIDVTPAETGGARFVVRLPASRNA
jgi:signal transduction histidine kinase/HAMP domain-containing protein